MVEVEGIFTHMATADCDKEYLDYQIQNFKNLISRLRLEWREVCSFRKYSDITPKGI